MKTKQEAEDHFKEKLGGLTPGEYEAKQYGYDVEKFKEYKISSGKRYFVTCEYCKKEFQRQPSHILKVKRHFCCKDHFMKWKKMDKNVKEIH